MATKKAAGGYPRTQTEMFGAPPMPEVVYPQRQPHMYGNWMYDNNWVSGIGTRSIGGDFDDMYRASGNLELAGPPRPTIEQRLAAESAERMARMDARFAESAAQRLAAEIGPNDPGGYRSAYKNYGDGLGGPGKTGMVARDAWFHPRTGRPHGVLTRYPIEGSAGQYVHYPHDPNRPLPGFMQPVPDVPAVAAQQAVDRLPAVLGGRDMIAGPGMVPSGGGGGGMLDAPQGGALVPQGGALAAQGHGMTLNRPALPGGPIDMGMVERVYPVPATMQGGAPAMVPPADGPGVLARAGGVAARGLGALGALGMAADLFYTPQSDIDILNSAARQGRGRSQGADGPQTQGYSAGPVNSRGQGFTDPRLIRAPAQPARPAPRPVAYPAPAPVNYDNGGVRTGPNVGIDDETRMAAMRALGIMP
ncbi:MAG: hypothetical protein ACRC8U_04825 [Brooklawnia sp.]